MAIGPSWNLPEPLSFRPLAGGTNNSVQLMETPAGSYVVRLYRNHTDPARLDFEHTILVALQTIGLPFAVPVPIPSRTGDRYVWLRTDEGDILATLTNLIPGRPPLRRSLEQTTAAGEALGVLDLALARIDPHLANEGTSWRSYGDLERCHPLVPNPYEGILQLPLTDESRHRLLARYLWLGEQIPVLYANLPQQLSHEDYTPDNMLMEETQVAGVLDFEFCARDLRIMDLTVALSWWPIAEFGTGEEWPIMKAFLEGYARRIALTVEEVAAIPVVYQLRAYTSLIHRLGRYRQGMSPLQAVVDRAHAALEREDWLADSGGRLVQMLRNSLVH